MENWEGRRRNASNVASFPSLLNIELMLSCVMKRGQTLRYSMRWGAGGCRMMCWFVWVHSYNAPLCLNRSASYGPILPHIPRHHPLYHQICSGATETGGPGLCIFLFFLLLLSWTWSPQRPCLVTLWSNLGFLLWQTQVYPFKNECNPPVLYVMQRITCTLTWTRVKTQTHSRKGNILTDLSGGIK